MKKAIFNTIITIALIVLLGLGFTGIAMKYYTYGATAVVIEVNTEDDYVAFTDAETDNVWIWDDADDWEEGDVASMVMFTKFTDKIGDDIIINVRYAGFSY